MVVIFCYIFFFVSLSVSLLLRCLFHFPLFRRVNFILCTRTAIHIEININPILFSPYLLYALCLSRSGHGGNALYLDIGLSFIVFVVVVVLAIRCRCHDNIENDSE